MRARDDVDACDAALASPSVTGGDGDVLASLPRAPGADDAALERRVPYDDACAASERERISWSDGGVYGLRLLVPLAFFLLQILVQLRRGYRVRMGWFALPWNPLG